MEKLIIVEQQYVIIIVAEDWKNRREPTTKKSEREDYGEMSGNVWRAMMVRIIDLLISLFDGNHAILLIDVKLVPEP